MNIGDFDAQFNRVTAHFHLPTDASRDTIGTEWFQALQGYPLDVVEYSVTHLIRSSQDRFWPALGLLLSICRGRASSSTTGGKCATCHGSTWIESAPFKSNGMIYDGVLMRCPDCGVPPPNYKPAYRMGLTASEYADWSDAPRVDYMPEGNKSKPWHPEAKAQHVASMRVMFDRLKIKLFGQDAA